MARGLSASSYAYVICQARIHHVNMRNKGHLSSTPLITSTLCLLQDHRGFFCSPQGNKVCPTRMTDGTRANWDEPKQVAEFPRPILDEELSFLQRVRPDFALPDLRNFLLKWWIEMMKLGKITE